MERNDIDKLIKSKLQQDSELYENEMTQAKPFIWSAIQNQIKRENSLTWRHLAAAMVLLILGFTFILSFTKKEHQSELQVLSDKIDNLQKSYNSQVKIVQAKEYQVDSLGNELTRVEIPHEDLGQTASAQKERLVYQTDTVYVTQIEYITAVSEPVEVNESTLDTLEDHDEHLPINHVIYPSSSRLDQKPKPENIKLRFGSLTARNN